MSWLSCYMACKAVLYSLYCYRCIHYMLECRYILQCYYYYILYQWIYCNVITLTSHQCGLITFPLINRLCNHWWVTNIYISFIGIVVIHTVTFTFTVKLMNVNTILYSGKLCRGKGLANLLFLACEIDKWTDQQPEDY